MPNSDARQRDAELLTLSPFGAGGLNMSLSASLVPDNMVVVSENVRTDEESFARRPGAVKIAQLDTTGASKTFGTDGKYATITAASQLIMPAGGFALIVHFTAVWPSAGQTAWILSSKPNGAAYHTVSVKMSDAGVITVGWTDSTFVTRSVASAAVTNASVVHLLAIFDAPAGTFTIYIDNSSTGTPVTGIASTEKPSQASTNWVIGVDKETGGAVTANTHFDGAVDGLTLISLAGMRPASGTPTQTSVMLRQSLRQWPNPNMGGVIFNYDMDATGVSSLIDSSRYKNHAAVTGVITSTTSVGYNANVGNFAGAYDTADGHRYNLFAAAGNLFYEKTA